MCTCDPLWQLRGVVPDPGCVGWVPWAQHILRGLGRERGSEWGKTGTGQLVFNKEISFLPKNIFKMKQLFFW